MSRPTVRDLFTDAARRRSGGAVERAPCGHDGEVVVGSFVRCLDGCDERKVRAELVSRDLDRLRKMNARRREGTTCLHLAIDYEIDPFTRAPVKICCHCKEVVP